MMNFLLILALLASSAHAIPLCKGALSTKDESPAVSLAVTDSEYSSYEQLYLKYLSQSEDQEIYSQTFNPSAPSKNVHQNLDGISEAQLKAIYAYTINDYVFINQIYRSKSPSAGFKENPKMEAGAILVRKALSKIQNFKGILYRGTTLPSNVIKTYNVGAEVSFSGFSSTSRNRDIAKSFALSQLLVLHVKHGKSIAAYSHAYQEDEFLLDHGVKFVVLDRKTVTEPYRNPDGKVIKRTYELIELEEI